MKFDKLKQLQNIQLGEYRPDLGAMSALVAEALGSAAWVLAAVGAGSATSAIGGLTGSSAGGPLAIGLTVAVMLLIFAPLSGGHFNPAISLAAALAGRLPKGRVLPYALAQLAGGLAAAFSLRLLLQSSVLGTTTTHMGGLSALLLEALLTAWLAFVYLAVTEKDKALSLSALALGATLAANTLWAAHLSGASMNPVRSLAPALAAWDFSDLWIYLGGPLVGGALGARAYSAFKALS